MNYREGKQLPKAVVMAPFIAGWRNATGVSRDVTETLQGSFCLLPAAYEMGRTQRANQPKILGQNRKFFLSGTLLNMFDFDDKNRGEHLPISCAPPNTRSAERRTRRRPMLVKCFRSTVVVL
jgi:hypothetical protein